MKIQKLLVAAFLCTGLTFLVSCGDEGNSKSIGISFNPEKPFYSTADSSYSDINGDIQTLTAPWTKVVFTITNSHTSLFLYVDSLEITFRSSDGSISTQTVSLDEVGCVSGSGRTAYANIAPSGSFDGDADCDGTASPTETWYFSSLPESVSPVLTASVELSGFFHDNDVTTPVERAKKYAYFVTK